MTSDPILTSELAHRLILEMGSRDAIDIARRNCWHGIVALVLSFKRGLEPRKLSVQRVANPRWSVRP